MQMADTKSHLQQYHIDLNYSVTHTHKNIGNPENWPAPSAHPTPLPSPPPQKSNQTVMKRGNATEI